MADFNKVILLGNLTRDPELRYTNGGIAVCELGIAVNRRSNDPNKEEVCFVDIVVWDKQAENSGRFLQKGASVLIEGRLQLDQWQDRETGQKRSRLRVVAERVQFMGSNRSGQGRNEGDDGAYQSQVDNAPQRGNYQPHNDGAPQRTSYPASPPPQRGYQQSPPAAQAAPSQNYQAPPSAAVPPMPNDAFEVGGDEAEDDIPF